MKAEEKSRGEFKADGAFGARRVPLEMLKPADSPRVGGQSREHVRALVDAGADLPPILVHARTLRVIDGMHRWRAAQLRGDAEIPVIYVDGDDDDMFIRAVQENVAHGLPLSLGDRRAAAARILHAHPDWSDRSIAGICGLSPKTVGVVRRRSTEEIPQTGSRIGRDGRRRTLRPASASSARSSSSTPSSSTPPSKAAGVPTRDTVARDHRVLVQALLRDPSLRFSESGRAVLRRLAIHAADLEQWSDLLATVPPHCAGTVTELADAYARAWNLLAHRTRAGDRPAVISEETA